MDKAWPFLKAFYGFEPRSLRSPLVLLNSFPRSEIINELMPMHSASQHAGCSLGLFRSTVPREGEAICVQNVGNPLSSQDPREQSVLFVPKQQEFNRK